MSDFVDTKYVKTERQIRQKLTTYAVRKYYVLRIIFVVDEAGF